MPSLFEQNKRFIKAIAPELMSRLETIPKEADGIRCFASRTGSPTCKALDRTGRWVTLHSAIDPEKECDLALEKAQSASEGIVVLLGIGLGYPLLGLVRSDALKERTIVVVERDLVLFRRALEHLDWSALPRGTNIHLLIDEPLESVLRTITRIRTKKGFQDLILFPHASSVRRDPDFYKPLLHELDILKRSPFRTRQDTRGFARERLTVLILDSEYFLIHECVKALRALGHRVVSIPVSRERLVERLLDCVAREKPDFLLSINHLGFDEEGRMTDLLGNLRLPFAVWYVDSPTFIILNAKGNISPYCVLFLWEHAYLEPTKEQGFQKGYFLPLATDPSTFRPIRRNTIPTHFRGPVSFVGNSMVEAVDDWFARFPSSEITEAIARLAIPLQIKNHQQSMAKILERIAKEHGHHQKFEDPVHHLYLQAALVWKATLGYRRDLLERLQPFDIRIFGDQGWHEILNGGARILPPVNYHQDLPLIFNGTDVNVNATSYQMVSAVNQRVFDAAACGAFLVTDHQPDMDELFDRGRETVCYADAAQAKDQVAYYLKHPKDRHEIAQRARRRVLGEHTYVHRLTRMIAVMKHEFGSF